MVKGRSKFAGLLLVAALLFAGGEFGISVAGAGPANSHAAPGDLLSDGYDALGANRLDLARKIFQTLLNAYPQSTEAATAADELAALNGGDDPPDEPAVREASPPQAAPARQQQTPRHKLASRSLEQLHRAQLNFLMEAGDRVFFAENSGTIGGRARAVIEAQARWLKMREGLDVTIIGRAADAGSASDNKTLSLTRARAVETKLIEAGVPAARIRIEARGSSDPVATCTSPMCDSQNRHVESLLRFAGEGPAPLASSSRVRGEAVVRDETLGQVRNPTAR